MKKPPQKQFDPALLGILHRAGRVWAALVMRTAGTGRPASVVASREFPADQAHRLSAWLDDQNVGEALCVLPASSVICRTCSLPDAPLEHLTPALQLQAEAHLFGIAPPHRLGMAVLESTPGETTRSGIILAWPESASVDVPNLGRPTRFVADVACLAALLDGQRPTQPLIWLDRSSGSLALALCHANGAAFRGVREDADDLQSWKSAVGRVVAETGLSSGHTGTFIESLVRMVHEKVETMDSGSALLMLPKVVEESAASRLEKAPTDPKWWSLYGIAAGAAIARTTQLTPLTQLQQSAPIERPSILTTLVTKLSDVRVARAVVIACILILMFGPLLMSGVRLQVLRWRHADINQRLAAVNETRARLVMYRELERSSWSMTKVLSDIAVNTPESIELDLIRVVNQSRNFTVQGRALPDPKQSLSAVEVVELMQEQLRQTGIFHEFAITWGGADAYGHYSFTLTAKLLRPYRRYSYPEALDFALRSPSGSSGVTTVAAAPAQPRPSAGGTGEGSGSGRTQPPPSPPASDERSIRAPRTDFGDSAFGSADRPDGIAGGRPGGRTAPSADIPEPITAEVVASWSVPEAREALRRWSEARNAARARGEEELEQRLRDEFQLIMDRLRGGA